VREQIGTPLCVPNKEFIGIGKIASIEKDHKVVDSATKGQAVAMKVRDTFHCWGSAHSTGMLASWTAETSLSDMSLRCRVVSSPASLQPSPLVPVLPLCRLCGRLWGAMQMRFRSPTGVTLTWRTSS